MSKDLKVGLVIAAVIFLLLPSPKAFDGAMYVWAFIVNGIVSLTIGLFSSIIYFSLARPKRRNW